MQVKLSAETALAPSRAMTANAVGVNVRNNHYELLFGQRVADASVGLLVVPIPKMHLQRTLESSGPFMVDLRRSVERAGCVAALSEPASMVCDRTVFESSTILLLSHSDDDAELRFYKMPPMAVHAARKRQDKPDGLLEPVVRVFLPSNLLLALVESLTELSALERTGESNDEPLPE